VFELKGGIAAWIGKGYPYYSKSIGTISLPDYQKLIASNKIVLVEIGTKYCGLCAKAKRMVDSLQSSAFPAYKTIELELYDNTRLVADLQQVTAVPTLLLYKDGKIIWKRTGLDFDKKDIEAQVDKAQHDL
jgi:thiol-disulfide isomerase/thioredoxin